MISHIFILVLAFFDFHVWILLASLDTFWGSTYFNINVFSKNTVLQLDV